MTVGILDYGVGNVGSIENMLKFLGAHTRRCNSPHFSEGIDCLILPGVGSFDNAMEKLKTGGFVTPLNDFALSQKKPILGICIGMHAMGLGSEEGDESGLGWFDFRAKKIEAQEKFKVPHMGWNYVEFHDISLKESFREPKNRFYFCHSYCVEFTETEDTIITSTYSSKMSVGLQKENIVGVQFHPEKSHIFGMNFLEWFLKISGENH